jgi:hypothetical protein
MAVDDRHHIWAGLENLAVDEAFQKAAAAAVLARRRVEIEFHDVVGGDERGGDGARHQETVRIIGMAHADMAEGVDDALVGENADCRGEFFQDLAVDRTA